MMRNMFILMVKYENNDENNDENQNNEGVHDEENVYSDDVVDAKVSQIRMMIMLMRLPMILRRTIVIDIACHSDICPVL